MERERKKEIDSVRKRERYRWGREREGGRWS